MANKFSTSLYTLVGGGDGSSSISGQYVLKAGDTMTGLLELSGDAVNPLNPVTLQQFNLGLVGLVPKGSVEAASTGNVNLAAPVSASFDGHTVNPNDRVLIQLQTLPIENGIYVFNGVGVAMTRDPLMATGSNAYGAYVSVVNGATYGASFRICISDPGIVDTDDLVWAFQAGLVFGDGSTIDVTGNIVSLANGGILDVHVNAAAAIQGTKISPDFGSQFVTSLGGASFETLELQNNGIDTGWLALPFVSVPTPSASVTKVFAEALNTLSFIGDGFYAKFSMGTFSANRTFTLPNASGILGLVPASGFVTSTGTALTSVAAIDLGLDVTGTLPVANGGTGSISYTQGSVIFANASQLTEDNNNFFWDDTNNRLGIRTAANPTSALQIGVADATKYLQMDPNAGLIVTGSGSNLTRIVAESTFGSSIPAEIAASSRPSGAMGGFEDLGWFSFFGRDNAGNQRRGAYIRGITSGAWTSTSLPTHMDFFTVPSGSASEVQRARLFSSGEFYVGATGLVGSTGTLNVGPLTSSKVGIYVRGQSGQTADLLQLQNNSAVTLMNVEADGDLNARSLKATGTLGAGFLELANQSVGLTAPTSAIRVFSSGGNLAVKTSSPTYTFDHSFLSTNRTFQFQDADYLIANVPASIGPVKSSGSDLTVGQIDLVTDITGTLDIGNGGTGVTSIAAGVVTSSGAALSSVTFPSAGVVTSDGSSFSSYYREVLRVNVTQSVATTTPTTLTQLTSSSLPTGTYKFTGVLIFQTTATGTGVGFRLNQVSATVSNVGAAWSIAQGANGTAHNFEYSQNSLATNVSSASFTSANVNAIATVDGVFTVSSAGTVAIQMRSETGTSVSIRDGSFIEITAI